MADKVTVDITTGIGVLSFPRVFASTADTNEKGEKQYDVQFLLPKSDKESARAILLAIKKVGEAKWGDRWKQVRNPFRDGDKEADELTEDGSTTKGEKYPERAGHYFINARSKRPVAVVDRGLSPIVEPGEIYAGVKGKISVSFYPYSSNGNHGIGCGLNGVQKIADGNPIGGGGKPAVETMFEMLDEADDLGLDDVDEVVEEPKPVAKKASAKKAPAKKASAKPEPDDLDDLGDEDVSDVDESDLYDDL